MTEIKCCCSWVKPCENNACGAFNFNGDVYFVCYSCFVSLKKSNPIAMRGLRLARFSLPKKICQK